MKDESVVSEKLILKRRIFRTIVGIIAVVFLMLCIPQKYTFKDGGTTMWRSVLYDVYDWHSFGCEKNGEYGILVGKQVVILGLSVYDGSYIEPTGTD